MGKGFPPGFSWDPKKRNSVKAERGIDLADMVALFDRPHTQNLQTRLNQRTGQSEQRIVAVGFVGSKLYRVVYVLRGSTKHLITALKASQYDAQDYVQVHFDQPQQGDEPWRIRRRRMSGRRTPKKGRTED